LNVRGEKRSFPRKASDSPLKVGRKKLQHTLFSGKSHLPERSGLSTEYGKGGEMGIEFIHYAQEISLKEEEEKEVEGKKY